MQIAPRKKRRSNSNTSSTTKSAAGSSAAAPAAPAIIFGSLAEPIKGRWSVVGRLYKVSHQDLFLVTSRGESVQLRLRNNRQLDWSLMKVGAVLVVQGNSTVSKLPPHAESSYMASISSLTRVELLSDTRAFYPERPFHWTSVSLLCARVALAGHYSLCGVVESVQEGYMTLFDRRSVDSGMRVTAQVPHNTGGCAIGDVFCLLFSKCRRVGGAQHVVLYDTKKYLRNPPSLPEAQSLANWYRLEGQEALRKATQARKVQPKRRQQRSSAGGGQGTTSVLHRDISATASEEHSRVSIDLTCAPAAGTQQIRTTRSSNSSSNKNSNRSRSSRGSNMYGSASAAAAGVYGGSSSSTAAGRRIMESLVQPTAEDELFIAAEYEDTMLRAEDGSTKLTPVELTEEERILLPQLFVDYVDGGNLMSEAAYFDGAAAQTDIFNQRTLNSVSRHFNMTFEEKQKFYAQMRDAERHLRE